MTAPTLPDFLLARYAEDEAVAEGVHRGAWTSRVALLPPDLYGHIVRQHPARVLADVEAKRRIVAEHPHEFIEGDGRLVSDSWSCQTCHDGATDWWCITLRALALPYADHPDYREEWKP